MSYYYLIYLPKFGVQKTLGTEVSREEVAIEVGTTPQTEIPPTYEIIPTPTTSTFTPDNIPEPEITPDTLTTPDYSDNLEVREAENKARRAESCRNQTDLYMNCIEAFNRKMDAYNNCQKINDDAKQRYNDETQLYTECIDRYNTNLENYNECMDPNSWKHSSYCTKPFKLCTKPYTFFNPTYCSKPTIMCIKPLCF